MGRAPRYIPRPGALVEITQRTLGGHYFLRPSEEFNEIFVGVLAHAREHHPLDIVAVQCLSNHFHLLVCPETVQQMSDFMKIFSTNLAKEVNRLLGRKETVFPRRYQHIPVSDEEAAQVERLVYLLSQGVKEGLVARPQDWPGVQSADAMLSGEPLQGAWFDRSREDDLRRRGREALKRDIEKRVQVPLTPLPCWRHLSPQARQRRIQDLLSRIEVQASKEHRRRGTHPLGAQWVLRQDPWHRPESSVRTPAPRFHAATRKVRKAMQDAFRLFLLDYREAAKQLLLGQRDVRFPPGCFPPALPFVNTEPAAVIRGP